MNTSVRHFLFILTAVLFSLSVLAQDNYFIQHDTSTDPVDYTAEEIAVFESELLLGGASPMVIPAASFSDDGFDPDATFFSFSSGQTKGTPGAFGCLKAPVFLPHDVTVMSMFATINDTDVDDNVTVSLRKADSFSGATVLMGEATTTSSSGLVSIFDGTITDPTVFHPNDLLYVTTCLPSADTAILTVRVYFSN